MPPGNLHDRRHRRRTAERMHRNNRPGARRNRRLDAFGIDVERARLDIHEHRGGPLIAHRIRHRHERE
jgi:hypothetical protein